MSRVYQALEKAEREKREEVREESAFKTFQKETLSINEKGPLKLEEEKKAGVELSPEETPPMLTVPPNSFAAEQFRKLKTQIFLRSPIPHSILVTSTGPGEGKTTVSVNLAIAISQEIQKKAILIDGDLRKSSIQFGKNRRLKGLSNYLSDQTSLREILTNSEIENLWFIPAGPSSQRSSELIGSDKMREFLTSLREFGDDTYVIIDSPPILSTADPTLLSNLVDGVILVVMADRTPKESIRRAVQSIDRQKIIGVVFNQKESKSSLGYYSAYHYGYYKK